MGGYMRPLGAGRRLLALLLAALLVSTACSKSSPADVAEAPEVETSTPIARDPAVTAGKLPNGLTYYVQRNTNPGTRVDLRLVVDVGAAADEPGLAGTAHYLEHLAFNGTDAYPGTSLRDTLAALGAQFGPHLNASTSWDETIYQLSLSNDTESLETGLGILHEWATALTIDPAEVEAERGVVLEEWRTRVGADALAEDARMDAFLVDTPLDERDIIGDEASLAAITADDLRAFYETYYRPDRMAVVVVGDIVVDDMDEAIAEAFAAIPMGSDPAPELVEMEPWTGVRTSSFVDEGVTGPWVQVEIPFEANDLSTVEEWRRDWHRAFALDVVTDRLEDDLRRGDLRASGAGSFRYDPTRELDSYAIRVATSTGAERSTAEALLSEIERVRRHGVTEAEVERVRTEYEADIENRFDESGSSQDGELADALAYHHLENDAHPSPADERDIDHDIVSEVDVDDVEAAFAELFPADGAGLLVSVAGRPDGDVPTDAELVAMVDDLIDADIAERADTEIDASAALAAAPDPVGPAETRTWEFEDVHERVYPNGARVLILPTDIHASQVTLDAASFGGLGLVADADVAAAELIGQVIGQSGVGDLDRVTLDRVLADKDVSLSIGLDHTSDRVSGQAAADDLETLLSLTHVTMTAPRADETPLQQTLDRLLPIARNPEQYFDWAGWPALSEMVSGPDPRYRALPEPGQLERVTAADVSRVTAERFGDATGWVFALVGDVDLDEASDLADRYIGSLPGSGTAEEWAPIGQAFPAGDQQRRITTPGSQASVVRVMGTSMSGGPGDRLLADLTRLLVQDRLDERVRETLGATYGASVMLDVAYEPRDEVILFVQAQGEPGRIDELAAAIRDEIAALGSSGPSEADLRDAQTQLVKEYELWNNPSLADDLVRHALHPELDPTEIYRRPVQASSVAAPTITRFLRRLLTDAGSVEVIVSP